MKPFTKLFASIISSSIWRSPKETKVVWITMLAMSDKDGEVWASIGGLADMARVSRDECALALSELLSPDADSRTKEHDGRRIEAIDGGWRVLNYKKYRELGRTEDRREYFAEHKRQSRAVHTCPQKSTMSPIAEADTEAKTEKRESAVAPTLSLYIRTRTKERDSTESNQQSVAQLIQRFGLDMVKSVAEGICFRDGGKIWPDNAELMATLIGRTKPPPEPDEDELPDDLNSLPAGHPLKPKTRTP